MRAYVASAQGLQLIDRLLPDVSSDTVVARVHASALNRIDLKMAKGYRHGASGGTGATMGIEWAGEIVAVGTRVTGYAVGDRVAGMGAGAFADHVAARPIQLFALPPEMSFEQAVCFPVALRTMYEALVMSGGLQRGQTVLVQGASSAVGLVGMQIAKALGAALVIGTSTQDVRVARLGDYGADLALNSRDETWVEDTLAATAQAGVDLVIDQVSGSLLNQTLRATRILGRIVNVGRLGTNMQPFDAEMHAMRRISLIGTTFSSRTHEEFAAVTRGMLADLYPTLAAGVFRMPIAERFAFEDLPAAMEEMSDNRHFGKIVLKH
nr:zinc-binding dehydrogenase [Sphingomonas sp. H160509]